MILSFLIRRNAFNRLADIKRRREAAIKIDEAQNRFFRELRPEHLRGLLLSVKTSTKKDKESPESGQTSTKDKGTNQFLTEYNENGDPYPHPSNLPENETPKPAPRSNFENLVLAGGGAKAAAYCGVAWALEELDVLKDIKRFAGSSAGAIVATLLAIGYNSYDVEQIMNLNIEGLLRDEPFGKAAFMNLYFYFGIHPAVTFWNFMGDLIRHKSKQFGEDITFDEMYKEFGNELCIVITNVNTMTEEYCHMKTTLTMKIRDAVRMSMLYPVEFQAFRLNCSLYLDGGLLCNYPIHCFDGWWLKTDDSLHDEIKISAMYKDAFKGFNPKTLGCVVYSDGDYVTFRDKIEDNCKFDQKRNDIPGTKLARQKDQQRQELATLCADITEGLNAARDSFFNIFKEHSILERGEFVQTLTQAYKAEANQKGNAKKTARTYAEMLFGKCLNAETIFEAIEKKDRNKVHQQEIVTFVQKTHDVILRKYGFEKRKRKEIDGFKSFVTRILKGLNTQVMKVFFQELDVDRTIGINTHYIETLDFGLETNDKQFLINQGKLSTETFFSKRFPGKYKPVQSTIDNRKNGACLDKKKLEEFEWNAKWKKVYLRLRATSIQIFSAFFSQVSDLKLFEINVLDLLF